MTQVENRMDATIAAPKAAGTLGPSEELICRHICTHCAALGNIGVEVV